MKRQLAISFTILLLCVDGSRAEALLPAINWQGGTVTYNHGVDATVGWLFSVDSETDVTQLGVGTWAPLVNPQQVAIWEGLNADPLASATVPPSATRVNRFAYVAIAPVRLHPGTDYFIGQLYTPGSDPYNGPMVGNGVTFDPNINFLSQIRVFSRGAQEERGGRHPGAAEVRRRGLPARNVLDPARGNEGVGTLPLNKIEIQQVDEDLRRSQGRSRAPA
jgi:hypothetical protein